MLALGASDAPMALLEAQSPRPLAAFRACFAQAQERGGAAWAYLPGEQGGTFTDSGARGAAASYWLQVHAAGAATHMRLFADSSGGGLKAVTEAVEQCR